MSKLEAQKALPRRKLFRDVVSLDHRDGTKGPLKLAEPKRKAKKAKAKRA